MKNIVFLFLFMYSYSFSQCTFDFIMHDEGVASLVKKCNKTTIVLDTLNFLKLADTIQIKKISHREICILWVFEDIRYERESYIRIYSLELDGSVKAKPIYCYIERKKTSQNLKKESIVLKDNHIKILLKDTELKILYKDLEKESNIFELCD